MAGAVELKFFPQGCCPDLNSIEEVWYQMKHAGPYIQRVTVLSIHEDIDRWLGSLVLVLTSKSISTGWSRAGLLPAHRVGMLRVSSDPRDGCPRPCRKSGIGWLTTRGWQMRVVFCCGRRLSCLE